MDPFNDWRSFDEVDEVVEQTQNARTVKPKNASVTTTGKKKGNINSRFGKLSQQRNQQTNKLTKKYQEDELGEFLNDVHEKLLKKKEKLSKEINALFKVAPTPVVKAAIEVNKMTYYETVNKLKRFERSFTEKAKKEAQRQKNAFTAERNRTQYDGCNRAYCKGCEARFNEEKLETEKNKDAQKYLQAIEFRDGWNQVCEEYEAKYAGPSQGAKRVIKKTTDKANVIFRKIVETKQPKQTGKQPKQLVSGKQQQKTAAVARDTQLATQVKVELIAQATKLKQKQNPDATELIKTTLSMPEALRKAIAAFNTAVIGKNGKTQSTYNALVNTVNQMTKLPVSKKPARKTLIKKVKAAQDLRKALIAKRNQMLKSRATRV